MSLLNELLGSLAGYTSTGGPNEGEDNWVVNRPEGGHTTFHERNDDTTFIRDHSSDGGPASEQQVEGNPLSGYEQACTQAIEEATAPEE